MPSTARGTVSPQASRNAGRRSRSLDGAPRGCPELPRPSPCSAEPTMKVWAADPLIGIGPAPHMRSPS